MAVLPRQASRMASLLLLSLAVLSFRWMCQEAFVKPAPKAELQRSLSVMASGASTAWLVAMQEAAARRQYVDRFMEDEEPVDPTTTADGAGLSFESVLATLGMLPNLLVLVLFAGGVREFIARGGGFAQNEDA